jgi:hypothetical protein
MKFGGETMAQAILYIIRLTQFILYRDLGERKREKELQELTLSKHKQFFDFAHCERGARRNIANHFVVFCDKSHVSVESTRQTEFYDTKPRAPPFI